MASEVHIEQFEPSDEDALLAFLRVAYANQQRRAEPNFWRWHYLQNPYVLPDNLPIWVAWSGERIVGQLSAIPVKLKVDEEIRNAIWIMDLILSDEYRGQGLGKQLMLRGRDSCPIVLALGYNEISGNILRRLSWTPMGSLQRYQRLLFPGNALKGIATIAPLRKLLNLCYAPFRPRIGPQSAFRGLTLREVEKFDASFDDLWQRAAKPWSCTVARESKYLDWQFRRQPGKQYQALGLYDSDKLVGYAILFFRNHELSEAPPKAAISDICYDPERSVDVIDELLKGSLRRALERRAGSLVTDVRDPQIEERLRHFGFWRNKHAPSFMVHGPKEDRSLYQKTNWFLTRADCDVSIFEEPNI